MSPRYGILVQVAQLIAQLFIDWCVSKDLFKPIKLTIPGECLEKLQGDYTGVVVTITPVTKKRKRKI